MKTGYNKKAQAEALRNYRSPQGESVGGNYPKASPDVQWRDGQPQPQQDQSQPELHIDLRENMDEPMKSAESLHIVEAQPAQYQDGQSHFVGGGEVSQQKSAPMCESHGCINAASKILQQLDESVDPCENFYEFACGSYIKETMIPEDKVSLDPFDRLRDLINDQLKTIINEPVQPNESKPFKLAKNFNLACLNTSNIEAQGIKPLADILESYGGWPVVKGDSWSGDAFDWVNTIRRFRRMGLSTSMIFLFNMNVNLKDSLMRQLYVSCRKKSE